MKHNLSLILIISLFLCSTLAWSANLIAPGTYSGTWKLNVISNIVGRTITSSNIVVEAEEAGKQTITFNNFKLPYTSASETTIQLILSTSDKKITIASQNVGYNNGTYPVSIVTHDSYKSASLYDPATGVLTFGVKYVYTKNSTTYTYGNAFEYIELQLNDKWSEWVAFPSEEKNTAHWTINDETNPYWKDSIKTKVPTPEVKLYVRTSKTDNAVKQIKVENFNLGIKDAKNADVILDWDCSTNSISLTEQVLNSYYTYKSGSSNYANLAKAKTAEDGSIDIKTGELTLPLQYLKEGSRYSVNETLQLQDYEMPFSDWADFSPFGLSKGNYYVSANKNTWHENLNIQVRECTLDAQYKQIKVQDWNYSDNDKGKTDLIIDWNSVTNVCTIAQQPTNYTTNKKDIKVSTRSNGTYDLETATFSLPIKYATDEKVLSDDKTDVLQMQKAVTSISFDQEEYTLASGFVETITPTVDPEDATNKSVTYTSSDPSVATVDNGEDESHPAGKIHFQSVGTTTIKATANDGSGVSGSYKLTTFVRVTGITLDKTSVDLCPNSDVTLTATVEPSNATTQTVKWTSNKEDVVKVDENGKLQFVGIGSAIITASANDDSGKSSSCEVSTYRISLANPGYGTEYVVPVKGGKAYFKNAPSASQLQFVLEGKSFVKEDWEILGAKLSWITPSIGFDKQSKKVFFSFSAADSTLTPRAGSFSVEAYDYKFDGYTISQAAPTLTPEKGMDHDQAFTFLAAGDDTLLINGTKTAKIYLYSEVKLSSDNIAVKSKHGLVNISGGYGSTSNFIRLTLTRKQCIQEDAKDTVVVYFTDKPEIRYEYYITQAGTGKLTTSHDYRTLVFGPKANRRGRFVNESGNLSGTNYITIRADIPVGTINYRSDLAKDDRFYDLDMSIKNSGTDEEYLQIFPKTLSNTDVLLEDNVYFFIPNVDTITLHLVQEPTARVWQRFANSYTAMEVGNKGGKAHFSGYTETELTYISNTPIETDEVAITCADWIEASPIINTNKDTVRITFTIGEYLGMEPRTDTMTITIQGCEFRMPLNQKVFGIEWSLTGGGSELAIPVEGGKTTYLNIFGTEPYRETLLQITTPEGVSITDKSVTTLSTGRQRTSCKFKKEGSVTEDWQDTIFLALDTINQEAGFEYHYKDTIIITQPAPEPTYTRDNLTAGNWGTICLPYASKSFSGAEMYSIAGKMEGEIGIYLDQVEKMEAGVPYIFKATADKIEVDYYAIGDPTAANENANGLCGYIGESEESYITVPQDENSYIVYNNALYLVKSEATIASNRAYIKYNEVGTTPSPAPQVRRVAMPISGAPTSMLQVNGTKQPVKILRDGHIVILRADKEYDILGQSK